MAYILHKSTAPIRYSLTFALAPILSKIFYRKWKYCFKDIILKIIIIIIIIIKFKLIKNKLKNVTKI